MLELPRRLPGTIRGLANDYVRPGDVKLPMRHYSNSRERPHELGFFGAEARPSQGYGWQYIYLFFRNQDEAERFGIDEDYLDTIAGGIEELNEPEWLEYLEDNGGSDGAISQKLRATRNSGASSAFAPGRRRSSAARAAPAPCRTVPLWLRSKPRSKRSSSSCSRLG